MTTCTVEQLRQAYEDSPINATCITRAIRNVILNAKTTKFDEDAAQKWINYHHKQHLDHRLTKHERPWDIINITAKLDPAQPWVGIEYETGYRSKEAYQRVVNYLWQNIPWTAIDIEGGGNYPCEITFSPVNMNDFMSDDYKMDKLLRYMNGDGDAAKHGDGVFVGTHLNASTPAYRKMKDSLVIQFNLDLRQLLKQIDKGSDVQLFGRMPYGYNNAMGHGKTKWIEFKLFKSTGDMEQWQEYKAVMARIIQAIEYYARDPEALPPAHITKEGKRAEMYYPTDEDYTLVKSNFTDFLLGKFDNLAELKVEYAKRSSIRSYSTLNG